MPTFKTIEELTEAIANNECEEAIFKSSKFNIFGSSDLLPEQERALADAIRQNTSLTSLEISDVCLGHNRVISAIGDALGENRMPLRSLCLHNCRVTLNNTFCNGLRQNTTLTSLELSQPEYRMRGTIDLISALNPNDKTPTSREFGVNTTLESLNIKGTSPSNFNDAVRYAGMLGSTPSLKEIIVSNWRDAATSGHELEHILRVKNICNKLPGMMDARVVHSAFAEVPPYRQQFPKTIVCIEKQNISFMYGYGYLLRDKGKLHFVAPTKDKADEIEDILNNLNDINAQSNITNLTIERSDDNSLIVTAQNSKLTTLFETLEQGISSMQTTGRLIKSANKGVDTTNPTGAGAGIDGAAAPRWRDSIERERSSAAAAAHRA